MNRRTKENAKNPGGGAKADKSSKASKLPEPEPTSTPTEADELIAQVISYLPSAESFKAALLKEFPGDDPKRADQAIETIKEKLEKAERAFDPYSDKKLEAEEKASQIALHVPKEKSADVRKLAYLYYCLEDLHSYVTKVCRLPPDDLLVTVESLMRELFGAQVAAALLLDGDAVREEDRHIAYTLALLLDDAVYSHVRRHKEATGHDPSTKELQWFQEREEKRLVSLMDFVFPNAFDQYVGETFEFEPDKGRSRGRPRENEEETDVYKYEYWLKYKRRQPP